MVMLDDDARAMDGYLKGTYPVTCPFYLVKVALNNLRLACSTQTMDVCHDVKYVQMTCVTATTQSRHGTWGDTYKMGGHGGTHVKGGDMGEHM